MRMVTDATWVARCLAMAAGVLVLIAITSSSWQKSKVREEGDGGDRLLTCLSFPSSRQPSYSMSLPSPCGW